MSNIVYHISIEHGTVNNVMSQRNKLTYKQILWPMTNKLFSAHKHSSENSS